MIDPDAGLREDELERIVLRMMAKYPPMNVTHNSNGLFNKWMLGIVAGLIIVGIPGLIGAEIYNAGRMAALEANVTWLMTHERSAK